MNISPACAVRPRDPGHRVFHLTLDRELKAARPALAELVRLWYLRRTDGPLPPRSAFDALSMKTYLPHIFITEHEMASRRYRYRLVGTAITDLFQRNATGCYFDEIYSTPDLHDLRDIHDAVQASAQPRTVSGMLTPYDRAAVNVEGLLLPVSVREGQNPQILGVMYFYADQQNARNKAAEIAAYSAF